jgi:hypothetical protein
VATHEHALDGARAIMKISRETPSVDEVEYGRYFIGREIALQAALIEPELTRDGCNTVSASQGEGQRPKMRGDASAS